MVNPPTDDRGREGPLANEYSLPELSVSRDGAWFDGDVEITHPGIVANLRATLRRDAEGYHIQTRVRIPVAVEDAPFVVDRIERRGGTLHALVNDGTEEIVDPATLRFGPANVPYCAIKGGAFEARLSRAAAFQLLALAEHDERAGRSVLRIGGREYPLPLAS